MKKPLRILHIEDSERDVTLLSRYLEESGYQLVSERVETADDMNAALASSKWDIILCNYSMPRFDALSALNVLRKSGLDIPFLIISGTIGEDIAVKALLNGANDYILKDNLTRLKPSIERELLQAEERRAKRKTENALKASEAELRALFAAMNDIVIVFDYDGRHLKVAPTNPKYLYKHGTNRIGKTVHEIYPPDFADFLLTNIQTCLDESRTLNLEYSLSIDGNDRWFNGTVTPMTDDSAVWVARDNTERKRAEEALRESNEKFHQLADNLTDVFWIRSRDMSKIHYISPAYEKIWGRSLRGDYADPHEWQGYIVPDDQQRVKDAYASLMDDAPNIEVEFRIVRPDDEIRWVRARGFQVRDIEGNIIRLAGIVTDITESRHSIEALAESEERYRELVENAIDIIYTHDLKGNYTSANKAAEVITGYTNAEALALNMADTIHPGQVEKAKKMIAAKLAGENVTAYELELIAKDGHTVPVEVNTRIIYENGVPVGIQGIARDITERKLAQKSLAELTERTEKRERMLTTMLSSISDFAQIYDPEGRIIFVNQAVLELWGRTLEDVVGKTFHDLEYPDELATKLLRQIVQVYHTRKPITDETPFTGVNGIPGFYEYIFSPAISPDGRVEFVVGSTRDVTERKAAEAALKAAEENYRSIFENAVEGICQTALEGRFISANPAAARILGFDSPEELIALRDIGSQHYVDPATRVELGALLEEHGVVAAYEAEVYKKDGSSIWTQENVRAIRGTDGHIHHYEGSIEDITARKSLEEQFRQSQKMEAVGVMAGGIAHDFNNLLTAINGYSDLTLSGMSPEDPLRRNIEEILRAGERAAELTSQLLAFSRKQVLKPVVHNLNSVIETMQKMLRRIIPENIELRTVLDADLGNIMADPGQVEQVIMNLAANARDAMPDGGTLTIKTQNVYLDHKYMSHKLAIEPGPFVKMTVSDTGTGMDASTQQHIFEPFFTTKGVGKGTGLGLSMVYGIVKQSGGDVLVYSEPGHGTTFKIYLPRVDKTIEKQKWIGDRIASHVGTETVLLVEDEALVRNLVREILTGKGYNVMEASSGDEALAVCKSHSGPIHLLLTDVIMPKMGGREVKEAVAKLHPDIKVLFMSGYTDDSISHGGIFDSAAEFIEKPFTPDRLIDKVRGVLEQ